MTTCSDSNKFDTDKHVKNQRETFELIYMEHYDLLLNYGQKINADKQFIKDCIQDLFVKLYDLKREINPDMNVRAYLIKSLRNIIFDKLHGNGRVREDCEELPFNYEIEENELKSLFGQDDNELALGLKLMSAYSALSSNRKQILYLRYVRSLSYKEIADILNINEQSAMNLGSRTLRKLRDFFDK